LDHSRRFYRVQFNSGQTLQADIIADCRDVSKVLNPDINPTDEAQKKSRPKAAFQFNLLILDQAAIDAGF
jgi:hypothetical protein